MYQYLISGNRIRHIRGTFEETQATASFTSFTFFTLFAAARTFGTGKLPSGDTNNAESAG